jgi:ketosteroid isomerase-like protein
MTDDDERLVRRCFAAFRTADRAVMEAVLHPDFTFTSPRDDHIDRAAYFGRGRAGAGFRNVERMSLRDGMIVATEVFFGHEPG